MECKNLAVATSEEWAKKWGNTSRYYALKSWAEAIATSFEAKGLTLSMYLDYYCSREECATFVVRGARDSHTWMVGLDNLPDAEAVLELGRVLSLRILTIDKIASGGKAKLARNHKYGFGFNSLNEKALNEVREILSDERLEGEFSVPRIRYTLGYCIPRPNPDVFELNVHCNYAREHDAWERLAKALLRHKGVDCGQLISIGYDDEE